MEELMITIFVHHFIEDLLLPRPTACAGIVMARASQKKSPMPHRITLSLAISQRFVTPGPLIN